MRLIATKLWVLRILARVGIVAPMGPVKLLRVARAFLRWGPTPAGGYAIAAVRYTDRAAVIDDAGAVSYATMHRRANALANSLAQAGIKEGDGVAIMCRNHRGFIDAVVACSRLGAHALLLNTSFAAPQVTDVVARERPTALIYDSEFAPVIDEAAAGRLRIVARDAAPADLGARRLEDLIAAGDTADPPAPKEQGRVVILTSGTTGTPKGARRHQPKNLDPVAIMFSKIPFRAAETTVIAAPLFHTWGFAQFSLGMSLGSTLVLTPRFEPEATLRAITKQRASALVVVPVMLQRILELPDELLDLFDTPSLRIIAASGSALPGDLAVRAMDRFGDVLYNLYGSTEVYWATIATPADLRAAPATAGLPPRGTVIRILDEQGRELPANAPGRIFVGNGMMFEGYTGGGGKEVIGDLMATGDVGHLDEAGRLFIDGRDDEMIVSGGENVFPAEVEDLLHRHHAVAEAAVVGIDDERFGQRLRAFVVPAVPDLSEEALKAHIKANLAGYKVPREIVFLDQLPRNATGKVLKRELKAR